MAKTYIKKKSDKAGPNAAGPKYRTPSGFIGSKFSGKQGSKAGFKPKAFKQTQHRG